MRAVLDACVLYPTVQREVLLEVAREGLFEPLWSERLLEEWSRTAAARQEPEAPGLIAAMRAAFPQSMVAPGDEAALWLPDPADVHVLATAIAGGADAIVTMNLKDFPKRELVGHGLRAVHPDAFLMELWLEHASAVEAAATRVHAVAERMSGPVGVRALFKKARLPRLGKALD